MILTKDRLNQILVVICSIIFSYLISVNPNFNMGVGDFSIFALLIFLLVLFFINNKEAFNINKLCFILFLLEILMLIVSYAFNSSGFGSIATIIVFSLILQITSIVKLEKKSLLIILAITLFFWIYSLTRDYRLSYINTNDASCIVYYMSIIIISIINVLLNNKKKKNISIFAVIFITFLNIYKYDSRNIMFILLLLFVLSLFQFSDFFQKFKKQKLFTIWFLITIGSLLITRLYIYLYSNNFNFVLPLISSKGLYTGRERIWRELYVALESNYLFGIGSKSYLFPSIGAHNYMLSVLVLFGVPHFIVFIGMIYNYIKRFFVNSFSSNDFICFISIISLFITEFFEASFIGGRKLYVLLLLSIIFFSYNKKGVINNEKN